MMHPAEDFGSFLATVYLSDHMGTPANNIVLAVRNQMQRGNFEPAAKYLYFRQIEGRFEAPKRVTKTALGDITFKEVVEAIRGTDGVVIPELTVKAVELLQRGAVTIQKLEAAN